MVEPNFAYRKLFSGDFLQHLDLGVKQIKDTQIFI
jgi:hypothetical protein